MKRKFKSNKFKNLSPLYLVAGCGGGGGSSVAPSITYDAGAIDVSGTSALLYTLWAQARVSYVDPVFQSEPNSLVGLSVDTEADESILIEAGLHSLTIMSGGAAYAHAQDWPGIVSDPSQPVVVSGDLWLVAAASDQQLPLTLNLEITSGSLGFDLEDENQVLVLSQDSTITFNGNDMRVSDGTVDLTSSTIQELGSVYLGSSLIFTVSQLSELTGRVVPISDNAFIEIVITEMSDLDGLADKLAGKITDTSITIGLEAKSPEVVEAISEFIADEGSNPAFGGAPLTLTDGQNDAPSNIEISTTSISENITPGTAAFTFTVTDPDANDLHNVVVSDNRFQVVGDTVYLSETASIDYETESTINITITATDAGGLQLSQDFLISVDDVNDPPTSLSIIPRLETVIEATYSPKTLVGTLDLSDDALGTIEYDLSGTHASFFEVKNQSIYLKPGLLPEYTDTEFLTVTVSATDPEFENLPPLQASFTLEILKSNTQLRADPDSGLVFEDLDSSQSLSHGDTLTIKFSEAIDAGSLEISDLRGTGVTWGDSTISAIGDDVAADVFMITLGTEFDLSAADAIFISRGNVEDVTGAVNGNVITFDLPQFGAPPPEPPTPPSDSAFNIDLIYSGVAEYRDVFLAGVAFWESVIIGDLSNVGGIDDLEILASVEYIDGRGGTLGYAGWTAKRSSNEKLPYRGEMTFDADDFAVMAFDEQFDVVLHEIGHVLGFGTLWSQFNLVSGSQYLGENAVREYQAAGGSTNYIPLETDGGPGTAYSHWDEFRLDDEIMTGYLNYGDNTFSRITIGAIEDLGYSVDYANAEPYVLPGTSVIA